MSVADIPSWATSLLACPRCRGSLARASDALMCSACGRVGAVENGILRFDLEREDASITWYRNKGGAHFFQRGQVPFAMSSLDTPVYHSHLAGIRPARSDAVVLDIGAGDGRNTKPWLDWGLDRVIATDAVGASLLRFRERLMADQPALLERLLLIECDARRLPLGPELVDTALAIESLYYLNEDYSLGLRECHRVLAPRGRLLVAERSWEGALLTRLLYGGVEDFLSLAHSRDMWDGSGEDRVRSRCFTEQELLAILQEHGWTPLQRTGVSAMALVLGYLRGQGKLEPLHSEALPRVQALLQTLGDHGQFRRTHVVIAEKSAHHGPMSSGPGSRSKA